MPNMTKRILQGSIASLALPIALAANASDTASSAAGQGDVLDARALAKSSNAFGVDLWKQFAKTPGNLAISPASISAALAMTRGGAKGETELQLRKVLHSDNDAQAAGKQWGRLIEELQGPSRPLTLRIANRLFGEKTFAFEQPFLDWTKTVFGAALEPLSFKGAPDASRMHINAWVADRTEHRIKDLLPSGSVAVDTRLVLVNAIYFHADWQLAFEKEATMPAPFHLDAPERTQDVSTMHSGKSFRVAELSGVRILEIPYKGADCAMLIVLPNKTDGLADVEKSFSAATIETWVSALAWRPSIVALPRFKLDPPAASPLGSALRALGMPLAFDRDKADFTGMANPPSPRDRLVVGEVFHKAFVTVDELGTEAAAATAVVMPTAAAAPMRTAPPFEFRADHPFLFFIIDKPSGLILFMGRVSDPSLGEGA